MAKFGFAAALLMSALLVVPAAAQSVEEVDARIETLLGSPETFYAAFEALYYALESGDMETVASLFSYPMVISLYGDELTLYSEDDLIDNYETIFISEVVDTVFDQEYAELFVNSDGVMFGNGEVWMTPYCTDSSCSADYWLVSAINIAE